MAGTESESHDHDYETESSGRTIETNESEMRQPGECNETVDPDVRAEVLQRYDHRCQTCGRRGPKKGGLATLHVHHIERDPDDGIGEHDLENLTLLCRPCHIWLHQQSTPDDSPVEITEADRSVLLPQDIEILRYLAEHGPSRTGDIAAGVPSELSVAAVRERLWVLMGLDNRVESRDEQIVDKDVETGDWGLTEQIETSARGHIPDDKQLLIQRVEDEQVRQALERGCGRSEVTDVFGITRRTTFNKAKRAHAYDFPLDAFGRGGRPSQDGRRDADGDQQKLEVVSEQAGDGDTVSTEQAGNSEIVSTEQIMNELTFANSVIENGEMRFLTKDLFGFYSQFFSRSLSVSTDQTGDTPESSDSSEISVETFEDEQSEATDSESSTVAASAGVDELAELRTRLQAVIDAVESLEESRTVEP